MCPSCNNGRDRKKFLFSLLPKNMDSFNYFDKLSENELAVLYMHPERNILLTKLSKGVGIEDRVNLQIRNESKIMLNWKNLKNIFAIRVLKLLNNILNLIITDLEFPILSS